VTAGLSQGAVIGISVGGSVAGLLAIAAAIVGIVLYKKKQRVMTPG